MNHLLTKEIRLPGLAHLLRRHPFLGKEIQLLLPAYAVALLLAVAPVWLLGWLAEGHMNADTLFSATPCLWFGALMLAISSFGREFGLNTFPLLLAQPVVRARVWKTKVNLLICALISVFAACALSFMIGRALSGRPVWDWNLYWLVAGWNWAAILFWSVQAVVSLLVILASGLWATLLLRQMSVAFWVALLVPLAIWMLSSSLDAGLPLVSDATMVVYSVVGIWWARRHFFRAQETGWTGGNVELSGWRSAVAASRPGIRAHRPLAALCRKELKLQQAGLIGMTVLLLMHLGVVLWRKAESRVADPNYMLATMLQMFGCLWLLVPLLTASLSVAEERRMGTWEGRMTLPVSSRVQFVIKLLFVIVLNGLLSGALFWLVEGLAAAINAGPGPDGLSISLSGFGVVLAIFTAFSLVTFYASTLSRNLMQAMATTIGVTTVMVVGYGLLAAAPTMIDIPLWNGAGLLPLVAVPVTTLTLVVLAYGNFRRLSENRRLWYRNLGGLAGSMAGIAILTAGVYNRAWEYLTPLEPAHGPARLSLAQPPDFRADFWDTSVILPDGRLWQDRPYYDQGEGRWTGWAGVQHFAVGSNWVSQAANRREHFGVRSDGTLWSSEFVNPPAKWARFGGKSDWKKITPQPAYRNQMGAGVMLLLKTDGTLWRWGTNQFHGPQLHVMPPHQLGTASDWTDLFSTGEQAFAWKNKQAFLLEFPNDSDLQNAARHNPPLVLLDSEVAVKRYPAFDDTKWRSLAFPHLGARADGTLWNLTRLNGWTTQGVGPASLQKVDDGTNWISVAQSDGLLVALKADGSLWKWDAGPGLGFAGQQFWRPPTRLGIHTDWVGLGATEYGMMSLAADGSLWSWPDTGNHYGLLAASRKPARIENIFDGQ